jgi:hypothetical protein
MLEGLPVIHPRKLSGRERIAQRAQLIELFKHCLESYVKYLNDHLPPCQITEANVGREPAPNFQHKLTMLVHTSFYSVLLFPDWQEWLEAQYPVLPTHEQAHIETEVGSNPFLVLDPTRIEPAERAMFWKVEQDGTAWATLPNATIWSAAVLFPIFDPEAFAERYAQLMT